MLSKIYGAGLFGIQGVLVCCESDIGNGLPGTSIIGYLSSEVREAADRVKTAIKNSGIKLEPRKVVINLSPEDFRKDGTGYDLPISVSILAAYGLVKPDLLENSVFLGELSLGGEILPVRGCLSITMAAKEAGFQRIFVPKENVREAKIIDDIECIAVNTLTEVVGILNGEIRPDAFAVNREVRDSNRFCAIAEDDKIESDFSDIYGQEGTKRATIIAVAGRHNIMYIGPAGTGKSMIARRIPGIMPGLSKEEALDVTRIHSICGILERSLITQRPFRSPHHTTSMQALCGGGIRPKPGEVSLATHGVLFLDEFAEFKRDTIEVLRQPLEDKKVCISRVHGAYEFPADFMLVCATNPCKCGFYPDREKCKCTEADVAKYIGKISKPLLDRIDICVETRMLNYDELNRGMRGESSESIRKRVEKVREIQEKRYQNSNILFNGEMKNVHIEDCCKLKTEEEKFLRNVYEKKSMSIRALYKVLKVARTIADLEGEDHIRKKHLGEALSYRTLEEKYWGGR